MQFSILLMLYLFIVFVLIPLYISIVMRRFGGSQLADVKLYTMYSLF